jgi:hypothetical protein
MALGVIKGVLHEELENSERMKLAYERELAKLPKGSLVRKPINGHTYFYLVLRDKHGKVELRYQGKQCSAAKQKRYAEAKELRAKYRHLLSQVKKQIRFLKGALRGKEPI